jgi:hypothetical protein
MALKETMNELKALLLALERDIDKAFKGNKTAAQRVRTGSIHFAKLSKLYRKESLSAERPSPKPRAPAKRVAKRKR